MVFIATAMFALRLAAFRGKYDQLHSGPEVLDCTVNLCGEMLSPSGRCAADNQAIYVHHFPSATITALGQRKSKYVAICVGQFPPRYGERLGPMSKISVVLSRCLPHLPIHSPELLPVMELK
jgi:hypothetical protein